MCKKVTLWQWPASQICHECNDGCAIQDMSEGGNEMVGDNAAICLIAKEKQDADCYGGEEFMGNENEMKDREGIMPKVIKNSIPYPSKFGNDALKEIQKKLGEIKAEIKQPSTLDPNRCELCSNITDVGNHDICSISHWIIPDVSKHPTWCPRKPK
jgi:hypothetical protein